MPITYTVAIDWDDDGDFDGAGEDITADVLALSWRLGMEAAHDTIAAPIAARAVVRSPARAYSPEAGVQPLLPGKPLRITSDDGAATRTHFTGFVERIEPQPGEQSARRAVIHARGPEPELRAHRLSLPLLRDVRASDVIQTALDAAPLRRVPLEGCWILDAPAHAELDENTRLAVLVPRSLETGRSVFSYVGDRWGDGISAMEAIRQMAAAERGRFFVNRLGELVFYNRHHTLLAAAPAATFADDMDGLSYAYGVDLVNVVDVTLEPRGIGATGSTLWSLKIQQLIQPDAENFRQITAHYRDANDNPIGALEVIRPVPGLDYHANLLNDGTGQDVTALVDMVLVEANGGSALLEFHNRGEADAYILAGAQLRGTPIIPGDPITVQAADMTSVSFYGGARLSLDAPVLDSLEDADQLARFEVARRKNPRGVVATLTLDARRHTTHALARTLFDRITIREAQTGHDSDYFIIAEAHEVDLGGSRHHVTWLLEPAAASAFWITDAATLDQTTTLAY